MATKTLDNMEPLDIVNTSLTNFSENSKDFQNFSSKIATFIQDQKWVRNSYLYSPAACVQYGWKCLNPHLLSCDTCSAKLSFNVPDIDSYVTYKECVNNLGKCLKTSHKKNCPWPINPFPDSYIKMAPVHREEAFSELRSRFESLISLKQNLPKIEDCAIEQLGLTSEFSTLLFNETDADNSDYRNSAVILATTGWIPKLEVGQKECIYCTFCQRKVALLLYMNFSHLSNGNSQSEAAPAESIDVEGDSQDTAEHTTNVESNEECTNVEFDKESPNVESNRDSTNVETNKESTNGELNKDKSDVTGTVLENAESQNLKTFQGAYKRHLESIKFDDSLLLEPAKKKLKFVQTYFNPFREHRSWCRWVTECGIQTIEINSSREDFDPSLGTNVQPMPGWKLFVKCLKKSNTETDKTSPTNEKIELAMDMLESWRSSVQENT